MWSISAESGFIPGLVLRNELIAGSVRDSSYAGARGTSSLVSAGARIPACTGIHPGSAWGLPLLRRRRSSDLRRKGQKPPVAAEFLFRRSRLADEPHPIDGEHR